MVSREDFRIGPKAVEVLGTPSEVSAEELAVAAAVKVEDAVAVVKIVGTENSRPSEAVVATVIGEVMYT